MRFMLLVGVAFWSTITYAGILEAFERGGNALTERLADVHRALPGSLLVAGIAGSLAGTALVIVEIARIGQMAGEIGGFASAGFIAAVIGAACLAGHVVLRAGSSTTHM